MQHNFFWTLPQMCYFDVILHSKKKRCYIALKGVLWLVIIGEPLLVLYSTKSWCFSGSSAVLWHDWGAILHRYHIQNLLSSCKVLQQFFGVIKVLYSTTAVQRTCLAPLKVLYEPKNHCWCCLAPFLLKKYNAIWHLLWFYIAPFDKGAV